MNSIHTLTTVLLLLAGTAIAQPDSTVVIASGQEGGQYHAAGTAIAGVLGGGQHRVLVTQGSVDNLHRLFHEDPDEAAKLAIVQSDILHRLSQHSKRDLPDVLRDLPDGASNIRALIALFPEYLQILVGSDSEVLIPGQLLDRPLYLGGPNSGGRLNALDLLDYINASVSSARSGHSPDNKPDRSRSRYLDIVTHQDLLQLANVPLETLVTTLAALGEPPYNPEAADQLVSSRLALEMVRQGHIAAAFLTQGFLVDEPGLRHLHLPRQQLEKFREDFEYYGVRKMELPGATESVAIPFVRANLVSLDSNNSRSLSRAEVREITRTLHEGQLDLERRITNQIGSRVEIFMDDRMVRRLTDQLHPGAVEYFRSVNIIARVSLAELLFVIPLALIGLTFLGNLLRNTRPVRRLLRSRAIQSLYRPESTFQKCWDSYRSWLCGSWIVVCVWSFLIFFVLVVYFIRFVEQLHSVRSDIENPFAGNDFWNTAFWMVTFAATGFNQDIYPNTMIAKILAVLVPLSGLLLSLFVLVTQTFRSARETEKRAQGLLPPPAIKNHILICGWNDRVPALVTEMGSRSSPLAARSRIIIVAEPDTDKPLESLDCSDARVCFFRGKSSDPQVLAKVHAPYAKSAIVLADNLNLCDQNTRSILTTAALRAQIGLEKHAPGSDPRQPARPKTIVAELFYEKNRSHFERAGTTKIVSLDTLAGRGISHAVLNPGVSGLLVSLLRFSNEQVLRCEKAEELAAKRDGIDPVGATFSEAATTMRRSGRQLIAIHRYDRDSPGTSFELEFRKESPYIIRPVGEDAAYTILPEDNLVYVTTNRGLIGGEASRERRFLHNADLSTFRRGEESVLLIGNGDVGAEIAKVLAARSLRVVWIVPDPAASSSRPTFQENGNLMRIGIAGGPDSECLDDLREHLGGLTRAVILGPDRTASRSNAELHHDDATMLIALTLRKMEATGFAGFKDLHLAAEMRSRANLDLFHNIGIDQPIPTMELHELAMAQMAFHRGVATELLLKSMSYSPDNKKARLVRIPAAKISERLGEEAAGMDFDGLATACLAVGMQLLAIHSTAKLSTDEFPIIVNPPHPARPAPRFARRVPASPYRIASDDFAFVFDDPSRE